MSQRPHDHGAPHHHPAPPPHHPQAPYVHQAPSAVVDRSTVHETGLVGDPTVPVLDIPPNEDLNLSDEVKAALIAEDESALKEAQLAPPITVRGVTCRTTTVTTELLTDRSTSERYLS